MKTGDFLSNMKENKQLVKSRKKAMSCLYFSSGAACICKKHQEIFKGSRFVCACFLWDTNVICTLYKKEGLRK